jgi:branched-chain amino acid transport system ATP-binding protein
MLAIARGLMAGPRLLMIDEPTLGLAPVAVDRLTEALINLRERLRVNLLLVEQNASLAKAICSRAYVLVNGSIVHEAGRDAFEHDNLMAIYMGQKGT